MYFSTSFKEQGLSLLVWNNLEEGRHYICASLILYLRLYSLFTSQFFPILLGNVFPSLQCFRCLFHTSETFPTHFPVPHQQEQAGSSKKPLKKSFGVNSYNNSAQTAEGGSGHRANQSEYFITSIGAETTLTCCKTQWSIVMPPTGVFVLM